MPLSFIRALTKPVTSLLYAVNLRYLNIRERFASFSPCSAKKMLGCNLGVVHREKFVDPVA